MSILRRPLSGGTPISIIDTKGPKFPTDWSDDGGWATYNSQEPDYRGQHVWIASMNGESHPFLPLTYHAGSARFAPGADIPRWLAYTSDETGRYEIYIRSFPDGAHMFQISSRGGVMPQWRRDGWLTEFSEHFTPRVGPQQSLAAAWSISSSRCVVSSSSNSRSSPFLSHDGTSGSLASATTSRSYRASSTSNSLVRRYIHQELLVSATTTIRTTAPSWWARRGSNWHPSQSPSATSGALRRRLARPSEAARFR